MRVKVLKAPKAMWYATKIGQEFEVDETAETFYIVKNPDGWASHVYCIDKVDCVEVGPQGKAVLSRAEQIEEQWERAYQLLATIQGQEMLLAAEAGWSSDVGRDLAALLDEMEELHIPEGEHV